MDRVIHVVKPSGTRHQFTFRPTNGVAATDAQILKALASNRRVFGTVGTKPVRDPQLGQEIEHEDRFTGDIWDHPDLVVCEITEAADGQVSELKRLRGPAPKPEAPAAPAAPAKAAPKEASK